ncbi:DUF3299 domain-containing protein [Acuticoccus sp. MNP-M23]|uniref:DUF3299 domain-containing protein n=1 Tax=Acuticoccus sp. MNP-M23 TaxID=3072793 RepID=UPI002815DD14|nr:DUF3299 domain-containing protein [Acuticoccus sp. MNP-M23]WMS43195.1 DUF3299 domain-containing protein [Acuticoccus sp. MNP-M23]
MSVAIRGLFVLIAFVVGGLIMWQPWKDSVLAPAPATSTATLIGADGLPIEDDGSFKPINDPAAGQHDLVRYYMPTPEDTPPLAEDTTAIVWEDLWQEGDMTIEAAEEDRVGRPTADQFPEGTTAEDVMLFFLDMGDMRSMQPQMGSVKADMDGKRVRLAGYVTPVGFDETDPRFLLVPELGACIHVPPPPANQIVYVPEVKTGEAKMFDPVWVTGTLKAAPVATILADVGYQLVDAKVEPYR